MFGNICGRAAAMLTAAALIVAASPAFALFNQQGPKLVGSGSTAQGNLSTQQGTSVALSADGATMVVGGVNDNNGIGAAWIFVRNGTTWNQQGPKLVGSGFVDSDPFHVVQGWSVAISADGNTAIVGGPEDNHSKGAAWIFVRDNSGVWSQQGGKLFPNDTAGVVIRVGYSVALSADGNTALVGGMNDNSDHGATWVFTRSGGVWSQQGAKLIGTADPGVLTAQGFAVALSADGNTALIGGPRDGVSPNFNRGSAWVFTRNGAVWTQQGGKLVGNDTVTNSFIGSGQGTSVALSSDGNTALVGGSGDNTLVGAGFVYTRSGGVWTQQGSKLVGGPTIGSVQMGRSVALSGDGNIAILGTPFATASGGAFVFARSGGVWKQQFARIAGKDLRVSASASAAAISADGKYVALGAPADSDADAFGNIAQSLGATVVFSDFTIAVGGNAGGPFAPAAFEYTTFGAALTPLNYTITGVPDWLTVAPASGIVPASPNDTNEFVTIGFTANAAAAAKAAGTYGPQTITFTDTGSGASATITATFTVGPAPATKALFSAVLPASRAVQVGATATAFSTIINASNAPATGCGLGIAGDIAGGFSYQTTDPATNQASGAANTAVSIPAGGSQSYVLAITPRAPFDPTDVPITAGCANNGPAPSIVGLNTLLLSASATSVPDVVALAASSTPGYVILPASPSGSNETVAAFAVATINAGAGAHVTVTTDTGAASLPVTLSLCETDPASGQCTSVVAASVKLSMLPNDTKTFGIFVRTTGVIADDPAHNRIFVRFKDDKGMVRGATSVAVKTQ